MQTRYRGPRRTDRAAWLVLVSTGLIVVGCTIDAPQRLTPAPIEPAATAHQAAGTSVTLAMAPTPSAPAATPASSTRSRTPMSPGGAARPTAEGRA